MWFCRLSESYYKVCSTAEINLYFFFFSLVRKKRFYFPDSCYTTSFKMVRSNLLHLKQNFRLLFKVLHSFPVPFSVWKNPLNFQILNETWNLVMSAQRRKYWLSFKATWGNSNHDEINTSLFEQLLQERNSSVIKWKAVAYGETKLL